MANQLARIPLTGGCNRLLHPRFIGEDEMVTTKNLVPVVPGRLRTRPASTLEHLASQSVFRGEACSAIFAPWENVAPLLIAARQVGGAFATDSAVYACKLDEASTPSTRSFGGVTQFYPYFFSFQNVVVALGGPGSTKPGVLIRPGGGGSVILEDYGFFGTNNEGLRPALATITRDRHVYGNLAAGFESAILWTDPFELSIVGNDVLAANGNHIQIGPVDGDRITGLYEIMQTSIGAPSAAALLVLKEWSAYMLTGEPTLSDGSGQDTLEVNRISINCGCAAQQTIAQTPYGIIWAGPDDVWFFPRGQQPYAIGTKIRPVLKNTPANLRYKWHAAYDDGFYRLAVMSEGQGPDDDSPCGEQWWLDLRGGPPQSFQDAKWFGPQVYRAQHFGEANVNIGTRCFVTDNRVAAPRDLYFISDYSAAQSMWPVMGVNGVDSVDGAQATLVNGYYPAIEMDLLTREYDFQDPVTEKIFQGAEVDLFTSEVHRAFWKYILNTGGQSSGELSVDLTQPSGFQVDIDQLDSTTQLLSDESSPIALDPAPSRAVGKTIQLEMYSKGGFLINDDNNLVADFILGSGNDVTVKVAIPNAFYASLEALMLVVESTINAAIGGGTTVAWALNFPIQATASGSFPLIKWGTGIATLTAAEISRAAAFARLIGFTDWRSASGYSGSTITGSAVVQQYRSPIWEFGGADMKVMPIRRRVV